MGVAASSAAEQFTHEMAPNATEALRLLAEFNQQVEANIGEDQRLVVVQANGTLLALLVDRVREVLSVPKGLIDPPSRISSTERREMAGVARLNDGKRLILLLDTASLIEGGALDSLRRAAEDSNSNTTEVATDQQVRREQSLGERQFVTFRLAEGEYGIPIDQIQEIDRPAAMTRIPKAASYVEGITNLRGEVIPVINARKRFPSPHARGGRAVPRHHHRRQGEEDGPPRRLGARSAQPGRARHRAASRRGVRWHWPGVYLRHRESGGRQADDRPSGRDQDPRRVRNAKRLRGGRQRHGELRQ